MPAPALSLMLSLIYNTIPYELLNLAFEPQKYQTTIDQRILTEVWQGRVLNDVNLLIGKRTRIQLSQNWLMNITMPEFALIAGETYDAAYFLIPASARGGRNIATVESISDNYTFSLATTVGPIGNMNQMGNSVSSLANAALLSRTGMNNPIMPQVTLLSGNIVRLYPNTYTDGLILECKLEYDAELTNINQNVLYPLRDLLLCAVKTYIYNRLVISIDSSYIVGGMEIGKVKDIVESYENEASEYKELLMKVRGGSIMDPDVLSQFISMSL